MRPTLEHLPHEFLGLPLFGLGWVVYGMLGLLALGALLGGPYRKLAVESLPFGLILCAVAYLLLPNLEETYSLPDGTTNRGIPIRGYGVLLFLGTISGVWLGQQRARSRGIDAELIFGFATWLIAFGLLGGRIFYVVQYWKDFQAETFAGTLVEAMKVTQGGLVVYGALIGGGFAFFFFARRHRVPMLVLSDIAAPAMLLGLALGRIGCLLNGCCYGGLCEQPWAVRFPDESPVYAHQLANGTIYGFDTEWTTADELRVTTVIRGSSAANAGLEVGDVIVQAGDQILNPEVSDRFPSPSEGPLSLTTADGKRIALTPDTIPTRSQPVHPTQVYSALNATLVCLLLLLAEPLLTRTGQLTALMLTVYPVTRFLLEVIRNDESSFLQTSLTISQNVSVLLIICSFGLWLYTARQPVGLLTAAVGGKSVGN